MAYGQTKREPQLALNTTKLHACIRVVRQMEDKQVALAKQPFTLPELMELFVDKEHHAALRYVYDLIEPSGLTNNLYVATHMDPSVAQHATKNAAMKFNWWGKKAGGFYVPHKAGTAEDKPADLLKDQADPMLVERYMQVEAELLDIQCRFALCTHVLKTLNKFEVCKTLPQIRYVWPCITVLLSKASYDDDAKSLREPSIRAGDKANVPADIVKVLKETNDSIVRSLMLDDTPAPKASDLPVQYELVEHFVD